MAKRTFDAGNRQLNDLLDRLCAAQSGNATVVQVVSPGSGGSSSGSSGSGGSSNTTSNDPIITTRGTTTFNAGDLVATFEKKHVRALAGQNRRVDTVCTGTSVPGGALLHQSHGTVWVFVEDGVSPDLGDAAYVSATSAGRSTNVPPDDGALPIGTYHSGKTGNRALVILNIGKSESSK